MSPVSRRAALVQGLRDGSLSAFALPDTPPPPWYFDALWARKTDHAPVPLTVSPGLDSVQPGVAVLLVPAATFQHPSGSTGAAPIGAIVIYQGPVSAPVLITVQAAPAGTVTYPPDYPATVPLTVWCSFPGGGS